MPPSAMLISPQKMQLLDAKNCNPCSCKELRWWGLLWYFKPADHTVQVMRVPVLHDSLYCPWRANPVPFLKSKPTKHPPLSANRLRCTWSSFTAIPESFFHWFLGWKQLFSIFSHIPPSVHLVLVGQDLKFEAVSEGEQGFSVVLLIFCAPVIFISCYWVRFRYLPWVIMQFMFSKHNSVRLQQQSWEIALPCASAWANPFQSDSHALILLDYSATA